jgi:hypothetical protein
VAATELGGLGGLEAVESAWTGGVVSHMPLPSLSASKLGPGPGPQDAFPGPLGAAGEPHGQVTGGSGHTPGIC